MSQTFSFKRRYWAIGLGILWAVVFAGMSFYWAMGGMIGVRSLGGSIYEMSLNPTPSFLMTVWVTGFVKLLGVLLMILLLIRWSHPVMDRLLYYTPKIVGIALFAYGFLNFVSITLGALNILQFDLDAYATFWRLVFWEPFWMLGGMFYFYSVGFLKVKTLR